MVADLAASAWLVNGVDLATSSAELTHDGAGMWDGATEDAGLANPPGIDGAVDVGGLFRPYTRSVMYLVRGDNYTDTWAEIRALRRRCKPGRSVTLTRQMPDPEGASSNTSLTATARRQADRVSWLGAKAAVVDIDWLITGGPFYGPSVTIASAAGTHAIAGDVRARRIALTLAAGAARTITNTSNGYWLTFSTTVPSGGVEVDVEARTAIALTGSVDYSRYLSWGKLHPFQLDPGANTITVSAVSASIDYQPAYL